MWKIHGWCSSGCHRHMPIKCKTDMFSGGWSVTSKAFTVFEGRMLGVLVSFLVSVFEKLKQTEQGISVTSGAGPAPPPTPWCWMAVYKFHILQIHVHRGENTGQIPSSLPLSRRPLSLLDLWNGQSVIMWHARPMECGGRKDGFGWVLAWWLIWWSHPKNTLSKSWISNVLQPWN